MAEQGSKGSKGPSNHVPHRTGSTPKDVAPAKGDVHYGKSSGGTHGTKSGAR